MKFNTYLFLILMIFSSFISRAAYISNAPVCVVQPNGDTLRCYATGDEYYHRLHDAYGFTIIQNPLTGWYDYAQRASDGDLSASPFHAVTLSPNDGKEGNRPALIQMLLDHGIEPNLHVSSATWQKLQHRYDIPLHQQVVSTKTSGRNHGTINNVVIFVRFADDSEITTGFSTVNAMFNDSSAASRSLYSYFREASYQKLSIITSFFPAPLGNTILSYQDTFPRSYYLPYDATSNPNGYQESERADRELGLWQRTINFINTYYPVPSSLNLDSDNDGLVDNVVFVVKGANGGWNDLLWPHKWAIYDRTVYLGNKRVYTFNLQLEGAGSSYFNSSVLCHEMGHTLGAPDLYRYYTSTSVSPDGGWDLMGSNTNPPQHMSAYMKWRYGNWIDSIPTLTQSGTYTLHSVGEQNLDADPVKAYKIPSSDPNQFYVVEYRHNSDRFETTLPSSGLLFWRVDTRFSGNEAFDGVNTFDEYYVFRPNANDHFTNGNTSQAYFSGNSPRTSFTPSSNPHPWLSGNIPDSSFFITNISAPGSTISFTLNFTTPCDPTHLQVTDLTNTSALLSWTGESASYLLRVGPQGDTSNLTLIPTTQTSYLLTGLAPNTHYQWSVEAVCDNGALAQSSWATFHTPFCTNPSLDTIGTRNGTVYRLPLNTYYNYSHSQQIVLAEELGEARPLHNVSFFYTGANALNFKTNCYIYIGHTDLSEFSTSTSVASTQAAPCSTLTLVYHGPIHCTQGWNTFEFDTPFDYNGTQNLIIAVQDSTGYCLDNPFYDFAQSTTSTYRSFTRYSDVVCPNPDNHVSNTSVLVMNKMSWMRFGSCSTTESYTITASVSNPDQGTVSGTGTYEKGSLTLLTAHPSPHHLFSYWQDDEGTTYTSNPLQLPVFGNAHYTAFFAPDSHTIVAYTLSEELGTVLGSGTYLHGEGIALSAIPTTHYDFLYWVRSDSTIFTDNPLMFSVSDDEDYLALFQPKSYQLNVTFSGTASECASVSGTGIYPYSTEVALTILPTCSDAEFVRWSDGNTSNPRIVTLLSDTLFTAVIDRKVSIDQAEGEPVVIATQGQHLSISGADNQSVIITDLLGRIHFQTSSYHSAPITLPLHGVYLIKVGAAPVQRILIK